jgi:hypothetical protein
MATENSNLIGGTAWITIDGKNVLLEGALSYQIDGVDRTTLVGQDRVHGFSEKPLPGKIKACIRDSGGLSLSDFNRMRNVTVQLELNNGKNVIGRNMWTVGIQEVDTGESKFNLEFEGMEVEELRS